MQAEELRIGNLVYCWNPSNNTYNENIIKINWKHIRNRVQQPEDITYSPIPLTEEWLSRSGFKKCSDNGELKGNDCFYTHQNINGCISLPDFGWNLHRVYFKYVHQLQNFYFALTGEELEITI